MRLRFVVLVTALAASIPAAAPGLAGAAPRHNRGLTIRAVPHSIIAGEAVLVYGQLLGPDHANQVIDLYHRIAPNANYSLISATRTNPRGQYEFTRAEGIVETNRSWFVRGPTDTHSRTVYEQVAAEVTLAASAPSGTAGQPITFSGHLTPNHAGEAVLLQSQNGTAGRWTTIKRGQVDQGSNFQIPYSFRFPGAYDLRVLFTGDARNTAAPSDVLPVVIQQAENPNFTIQTSDPIVPNLSPFTISGTLYQPGTTTPEANTMVTLSVRTPQDGPFRTLTSTVTGSNGNYAFANLESSTNALYQVRTTFAPARNTAVLFQGVQDVVTMSASASTTAVGGHVTFTGNVSPDKAGHVIYLQRLGADGSWHTVQTRFVRTNSTFEFGWTFGNSGVDQFRARITGTGLPPNVGGASPPVTLDVTQPPLTSLPTN